MRTLLALLALLAPLAVDAADAPAPASPTAAAPAAPLVEAPLAPNPDRVTLKDGQRFEGRFVKYDAYFLEVEGKNGVRVNIPFKEILEITPGEYSGDTALMRQYLTRDSVEVGTRLVAKSPTRAFQAALWPGVLAHGWGYREAGNKDMFMSLAGAEIFAVLVGGFGGARSADSTLSAQEREAVKAMAITGAGVFVLTWIWDLAGAPLSAKSFNEEHQLSLAPGPAGARLAYSLRF